MKGQLTIEYNGKEYKTAIINEDITKEDVEKALTSMANLSYLKIELEDGRMILFNETVCKGAIFTYRFF